MNTPSLLTTDAALPGEHPDAARDRIAAEKLYRPAVQPAALKAPNAEVQSVRDADAGLRGMYRPTGYYGVTHDARGSRIGVVRDLALALDFKATDADLEARVPELSVIAADAGMNKNDVVKLTSVIREMRSSPWTPEKALQENETWAAKLRQKHLLDGPGVYDQAIADATSMATRDPRLKAILDKTGAGDHPEILTRFVELGQEARMRGTLTKKK